MDMNAGKLESLPARRGPGAGRLWRAAAAPDCAGHDQLGAAVDHSGARLVPAGDYNGFPCDQPSTERD